MPRKTMDDALDDAVVSLLLSGPTTNMTPTAKALFAAGLEAMSAAWRAHEVELRREAARRDIAPMWNGKFWGELAASSPSPGFRYPRPEARAADD